MLNDLPEYIYTKALDWVFSLAQRVYQYLEKTGKNLRATASET